MTEYIHVYAPLVIERQIFAGTCPDCKKRTLFLAWHYEWHGWAQTCLRCGRRWSDGEWMPLDFERGAREKSIASAKERWQKGKKGKNVSIRLG